MNFGPVTKLKRRNTATLESFDDDVMSKTYDAIAILSKYV